LFELTDIERTSGVIT